MAKKVSEKTKEHLRKIGSKGGKARKGKKNKNTVEREAIANQIKDVIAMRSHNLINAQTVLGMGAIKVFRIDSYYVGKKKVRKEPVIVTKDDELIKVMDWVYGTQSVDPNDQDTYYFVITKDPDNKAIKDMLDRGFGKATENKTITLEKGIGAILDEIEDDED